MKQLTCGQCGITDVRIYRPGGEFYRPKNNRCNGCLTPKQRDWYVPILPDSDGTIWGYRSAPEEAVQRFNALPEANLDVPVWKGNGFTE